MMVEGSNTTGPDVSLSLSGVKVFAILSDDERRYLETRCSYRCVAPGGVLVQRFSIGRAVFFLLAGRARVVHHTGDQDEVTIASIGAGEAIGEISVIDGGSASATIVADEDCIVAELPKEEFQALLVRRGEVALSLLRRWAGVIRDLDDKVSFMSRFGPEQRICSVLIRLARVDRPGSGRWLVPELPSHQELAMRAQTTSDAVARIIAELSTRGVVERRTRVLHILDYGVLKDMVRLGTPWSLAGSETETGKE